MSLPAPGASEEFGRGWRVLAASVVGLAFGTAPLVVNSVGFAFSSLKLETGWSLTEISAGLLIYGLSTAALAPFCGVLADRFGIRQIALASLAGVAAALALLAIFATTSLLVYYGLWVLLALLGTGTMAIIWSRTVNLWFARARGLALGILLMGTSLAALVVPQIAVRAAESGGWRGVFAAIAVLPLVVAAPLALAWFRAPRADETPAPLDSAGRHLGLSARGALRTRAFWLLWTSILLVSLAYAGAHVHLPGIVARHGVSPAGAANLLGVLGGAVVAGRLGAGVLLDRFWGPGVCFPLLLLPVAACWLLMGTTSSLAGLTLAVALLGLATGAEGDLLAYLASRYFGLRSFGQIAGFLYVPLGLAHAASPLLYATSRDATGSYDMMLVAAMLLFTIGAALLLGMGAYPDFRARPPGAGADGSGGAPVTGGPGSASSD